MSTEDDDRDILDEDLDDEDAEDLDDLDLDDEDEDICDECGELLDDCECDLDEDMEDCPGDCGKCPDTTNCCNYEGEPDESMDGDLQTGLRDAGFGVDEDYGVFDSDLD
jgi:hypothetical protein